MLVNSVLLVSQKLKSPFIFQNPGEFFYSVKAVFRLGGRAQAGPSPIRAGQSTGNGSSWAARKRLDKIIERTRILMRQFLTKEDRESEDLRGFQPIAIKQKEDKNTR